MSKVLNKNSGDNENKESVILSNAEVLSILKECNGYLDGHFLLTSGRHSDKYMQCAKLFENPQLSEKICKSLKFKLGNIKIDSVASPAIGGILMGYELARQFGVKNIFCERVDGIMSFRRGFSIKNNENILVAEDVVTTGGSIKETISLLKSLGANVVGCCSVVDRSNGKVEFEVPYTTLLSLDITSYTSEECPLCLAGSQPYKAGSRQF